MWTKSESFSANHSNNNNNNNSSSHTNNVNVKINSRDGSRGSNKRSSSTEEADIISSDDTMSHVSVPIQVPPTPYSSSGESKIYSCTRRYTFCRSRHSGSFYLKIGAAGKQSLDFISCVFIWKFNANIKYKYNIIFDGECFLASRKLFNSNISHSFL